MTQKTSLLGKSLCHFLVLTSLSLALFPISARAQGASINASGADPDPSAILDISSTDFGLLIPE